MRGRIAGLMVVVTALASCGGAPSPPPALAYRLPAETEATYAVADTAIIAIDALGQSLELNVRSTALYGVTFARADDGVTVTLVVEDLAADVTVPMAGPVSVDEGIISGELVFTLDRRGEATVLATPEVDEAGGQLVPPLTIAHSFFPALPGIAVAPGDTWTDTVFFEDASELGEGSQSSILEYTVVGDTVVEGRSLLAITFRGTSDVSQKLSLQGVELEQTTELRLQGWVLWDMQRGLMFERETNASGSGSVRVAVLPAALPTRIESRSRARLEVR